MEKIKQQLISIGLSLAIGLATIGAMSGSISSYAAPPKKGSSDIVSQDSAKIDADEIDKDKENINCSESDNEESIDFTDDKEYIQFPVNQPMTMSVLMKSLTNVEDMVTQLIKRLDQEDDL